MSSRRPLVALLVVILATVGVTTSLSHPTNVASLPNGFDVASSAESTALYCTGLTSARGPVAGHVTFLNTTDSPRSISVTVVSNTGQRAKSSLELAGHSSRTINPASLVAGLNYAVAAVVSGGGVVAEEVADTANAEVPCTSTGVTNWYGAGFDTKVGSNAYISIYNPTATPSVLNVSTYSPLGFAAPAPFQGIPVGAHSQLEIKLGTQIVNTVNVGVHVKALRGSVDVVGVQQSGGVVSLNSGSAATSTSLLFPKVTTVNAAMAQLRITNPNAEPANIVVKIELPNYQIAPQTVTVGPYRTDEFVITPNSAVPAAGYATVRLGSNRPVFASLATGTSSGLGLSSPGVVSRKFLVADFSGRGFNTAAVTNTGAKSITVNFSTVARDGQSAATGSAQLKGHATRGILNLFSGIITLKGVELFVSSTSSAMMVTTTLPSSPIGVTLVEPLDGR